MSTAEQKQPYVKLQSVSKLVSDPPLSGQIYAVFSSKIFDKPTAKGVLALVKVSGVYPTEEQAQERAKQLAQNDLTARYSIGLVGTWLPVVKNVENFSKTVKDLTEEESSAKKVDKSDYERELENQKQLQERAAELVKSSAGDGNTLVPEDTTTLDYYATKCNKCIQLRVFVDNQDRTKAEAIKKLKQNEKELEELDKKYPEYKKQWKPYLDKLRRDAGITTN